MPSNLFSGSTRRVHRALNDVEADAAAQDLLQTSDRLPVRFRRLATMQRARAAELCAGITRVMILRNECICSTSRDAR